MSFQDCEIKQEYRTLIDNVVQDFYIPLLKESVVYKRAVGFFSSTALLEISKGIGPMASKGGKIQLIASPYLSDEDIDAIQKGYAAREQIVEDALKRQLDSEEVSTDYFTTERLNLLANLIADGVLNIRIAYTEDPSGMGMYHEKLGIMEDGQGNKVAFSGSANETKTAMRTNYETVDVFCGWKSKTDAERVQAKENAFHAIWNDSEPNLKVLEFPQISQALIDKYRRNTLPNYLIDQEQFPKQPLNRRIGLEEPRGARIPRDVNLRDYQQEAIASWVGENYRGIFDMATGTGKTLTALGAISKISEDLQDRLAVLIVCPYQHLVEQWVEDIRRFHIKPIIGYSKSVQKDWKKRLERAIRDQKLKYGNPFFCFVTTNATFSSNYVQQQIGNIQQPILLVVDEAHNFGAKRLSAMMDDRFTYRLALSATLDRHHDEEGTKALYQFFGSKCITYTLERAIQEDKLTRYKYYPVVIHLTVEELEEYEQLSYEISKCVIVGKNGKKKLNSYGEMLAIKRSRIVAGAQEKLPALREKIRPYIHDNNILVYCGATQMQKGLVVENAPADEDIRQIDAVTRILGNEYGMSVARFTSAEDMEQRTLIKEQFSNGDGLQALVAIKCLDEGVNIPGIKTAFILASTTNPKEYIQRRGRVLRKAPNKPYAVIYDFVTLPRPLHSVSGLTAYQAKRDCGLVKNELRRMQEFGRMAMNPMETQTLMWEIMDTYHLENLEYDSDELMGEENE